MHPLFKTKTDIRVAFEDVDAFQVVHNAKYFCFFERGRLEYLRQLGFVNDGPASLSNFEVVIVEHGCVYRKPAVFDDLISVNLRISTMRNSSFQFQYAITRNPDNAILTLGFTNLVYIDRETLKPRPINPDVKEAILKYEGDNLGKNPGIPDFL